MWGTYIALCWMLLLPLRHRSHVVCRSPVEKSVIFTYLIFFASSCCWDQAKSFSTLVICGTDSWFSCSSILAFTSLATWYGENQHSDYLGSMHISRDVPQSITWIFFHNLKTSYKPAITVKDCSRRTKRMYDIHVGISLQYNTDPIHTMSRVLHVWGGQHN